LKRFIGYRIYYKIYKTRNLFHGIEMFQYQLEVPAGDSHSLPFRGYGCVKICFTNFQCRPLDLEIANLRKESVIPLFSPSPGIGVAATPLPLGSCNRASAEMRAPPGSWHCIPIVAAVSYGPVLVFILSSNYKRLRCACFCFLGITGFFTLTEVRY
jgi:hypothetical protein